MAPDVAVKELAPRTIAYLHEHGSFQGLPAALGTLIAWVEARGLTLSGAIGAHYFNDMARTPEDEWDWEVFAELEEPAAATDAREGIGVRQLPSALMATMLHRGPYDTVDETYERLGAWIDTHDYRHAGAPEEIYLSPPDVPPDEILTEVRIPVARPH